MTIRATLLSAAAFAVIASTAIAAPKDELIAADKAFSQLSVEKGSNAAFLAYMADDGRIFGTGNGPPIIGKAEAAKAFAAEPESDPKANVLSWKPDHAAASADGTQGFTDGRWLLQAVNAKGEKVQVTGHYLTVWKKDAHGAWKFAADMGTTDPRPKKE